MTIPLTLKRPIVFFDLETTGLDYKYDRIIEIGATKISPDGKKETLLKKINPGMRIPKEVQNLTGISNEDVAGCPSFAEAADEIMRFFGDSDLGGYNVHRFDAKVMDEECRRAGLDFNLPQRFVLDAQIIFHQKEKRDLSAAYQYYCGKKLVGAHSAQVDTDATVDILMAQIERYEDLPRDVEALHHFCRSDRERFVDNEGKLFWRDGEAVFNFGKYKSQPLKKVAQSHADYLQWIVSPDRRFGQDLVDICYNAMQGRFPEKKT